jgi:YHS domain-containing protein
LYYGQAAEALRALFRGSLCSARTWGARVTVPKSQRVPTKDLIPALGLQNPVHLRIMKTNQQFYAYVLSAGLCLVGACGRGSPPAVQTSPSDQKSAMTSAPKLTFKPSKPYPYPFSTCIVCGMKLDATAITFVQGDYEIKACGQADADEFKRNPDKYLPKIVQAYQDAKPNPLTTCAVCGMDIDSGFLPFVYEGRQFQVCDQDCLAEFQKDPAKYVKIWDDAEAKLASKP